MEGPDVWKLEHARDEGTLQTRKAALKTDPDNLQLHFELGVDYIALADESKWEYLDHAVTHLRKVKKAYPQHPHVLMHLGRAIGAKALNQKPSTLQRLRWAREGFKLMDSAVKKAPFDITLRLFRGESALLSHPILRRAKLLEQDANMLDSYISEAEFAVQSAYSKARIYLFHGDYLQKCERGREEVEKQWRQALILGAGSPAAAHAQARIDGSWRNLGYTED